ncbi:hypothetical protein GDO78_000486 [Eleutherodactylus coqui]|uniref:Uncharacterized protein n=1 Tax=Eleutherodactylus coqui TaxID=57060 RepID=A0A8J6FQ53_ELECQ|nr:hypothetical protein GDO78_000486 [Eleutherodactylus coqui]
MGVIQGQNGIYKNNAVLVIQYNFYSILNNVVGLRLSFGIMHSHIIGVIYRKNPSHMETIADQVLPVLVFIREAYWFHIWKSGRPHDNKNRLPFMVPCFCFPLHDSWPN